MSSDSPDENSGCRMSKVSPAMSIIRGLVEAKADINWYRPMSKPLIFGYLSFDAIT